MELKIEYLPVSALKPYDKNTRKHQKIDVDNIARSIEKYGMNDAIGIWGKDNIIVEGHGRLLACKKLGIDIVPVVRLDHLTDEQRREYAIAHNATAELSKWDFDILPDELADLDLSDFDFDFGTEDEEEAKIVEDEAPEVDENAEPITKLGDIWQLGRHRLMCGDSTSTESVQTLMGGVQADMLLTDPPYGVAYVGKTKDAMSIANDAKEDAEFVEFLASAFRAADATMKPGAVFYIWHAILKTWAFESACQMAGWEVRQVLIWVKNTLVIGRQDYQWKHEPCLYGWKAGAGHLWASDRKQTTVLEFDRPTANREHPTMKPVALFDYQMKNNTKGGDIVLDLFAGSGTTVVAAEQNGRTAYCMEYDPKYCDVIIKRWENLTGEKAVLLNG